MAPQRYPKPVICNTQPGVFEEHNQRLGPHHQNNGKDKIVTAKGMKENKGKISGTFLQMMTKNIWKKKLRQSLANAHTERTSMVLLLRFREAAWDDSLRYFPGVSTL